MAANGGPVSTLMCRKVGRRLRLDSLADVATARDSPWARGDQMTTGSVSTDASASYPLGPFGTIVDLRIQSQQEHNIQLVNAIEQRWTRRDFMKNIQKNTKNIQNVNNT